MYKSMAKLNRRRQNLLEEGESGFTLIELLVVVIIIGILAAIAIPVYLGVQNNARDSAVASDVSNLKTAAVSLETNSSSSTLPDALDVTVSSTTGKGTLPTSPDWAGAGATFSSGTHELIYQQGTTSTSFCVEGIGTETTPTTYAASDTQGVTKGATCVAGVLTGP